jgi:hypothetical protein
MKRNASVRALTAKEFFAERFEGFSMSAAQLGTGMAYSTIHAAANPDERKPSEETAKKLQEWSLGAIAQHRAYISAAKTLDILEPDATVLAAAAGGR